MIKMNVGLIIGFRNRDIGVNTVKNSFKTTNRQVQPSTMSRIMLINDHVEHSIT